MRHPCCFAVGAALVAGCAGAPAQRDTMPAAAAHGIGGPAATDPSYDWHGLILMPFGTFLKSSRVPLHEVLVFHDPAPAGGAADGDCHAPDGAAPRFAGRVPDAYDLCFVHDRLARIDASVRVAAVDGGATLERVCAVGRRDAAPEAAEAVADPPTAVPSAGARGCGGRDGAIAWNARLAEAADGAAVLTVVVAAVGEAPGAALAP